MIFNELLYNEKYRIPTIRLKEEGYGEGFYHVVICTRNRKHYFGEIRANVMYYSQVGFYTQQCIEEIPFHNKYTTVCEYQIMPNHIHLLIALSDMSPIVDKDSNIRKRSGLSIVIGGLKRAVKYWANTNCIDFAWQERYFDTIIRSSLQFSETVDYIRANINNWAQDEMNEST